MKRKCNQTRHSLSSLYLYSDVVIAILCLTIFVMLDPAISSAGYQTEFTPSLSIREDYTNNIFQTDEDTKEDFITLISPSFDLKVFQKTKGVNVFYRPEASFYSDYSENNTLRHTAKLDGWINISSTMKFQIFDTFRYTEEPFQRTEETISSEGLPLEVDETRRHGLETYYTNDIGAELDFQLGKMNLMKIGYINSILENKDPNLEDNVRHRPKINFMHQFSQFTDIDLGLSNTMCNYSDERDDFNNTKASMTLTRRFTKHFSGNLRYQHTFMDFKGATEDYQIYDPSVGMSYTLADGSHVSMNIGYFLQHKENSDDENGLSFSGNIGKTWKFRKGYINISGTGGYSEAYYGAEVLGFSKYYQASWSGSYLFAKNLTGRLFGSFRQSKYLDLPYDRKDNTGVSGAGLTFDPITIKWLSIDLTYVARKTNSSVDANDFREDRIQLSVTIRPSLPIRLN